MYHQDNKRLQSLQNERLLQIKREGIVVELYHKHQILPAYLQCGRNDKEKLQSILSFKVHLQLCNMGGKPIVPIPKLEYFILKKQQQDIFRVYLENKYKFRKYKEGTKFILVKNNATIGVLSRILEGRLSGDNYFHKIQQFIGDQNCTKIDLDQKLRLKYQQQNDLNQQQNLAIRKSFTNHLTFIKGPPGCGKTKTVSRMVKMLGQKQLKILVGSISNVANQSLITQIIKQVEQHNYLCEKFPQMKTKKLKLTINYSRLALMKLTQQTSRYSINYQLAGYIIQMDSQQEYEQDRIMDYINLVQSGQRVSNSFWAIYIKSYQKLISQVDIMISTTINSFKLYKYTKFKPDVGVVDQAAQASWTDTYGFLNFGVTRMVFVGDQKQLAPTVIGNSTGNKILKETMFDQLSQKNQDYFVHLTKQYRMHPKIAQFPNQHIYMGKLENAEITLKQRQSQLDYFKMLPISFVTHSFNEQVYEQPQTVDSKKGMKQFYNQIQGSLILDLLFTIPFHEWRNVGILTFYDMQCKILIGNLENMVHNYAQYDLTIKTIDGYQGGQKDYIIISTVRSNLQKNPGFCTQENRVNVALTRAKKGLIVFGDPSTLDQGRKSQDKDHNIWGKFYKFMLSKTQTKDYSQYQQIIQNIKRKNYIQNSIYALYQKLTHATQTLALVKEQKDQDQFIQKNENANKQAKNLINLVKNSQHQSPINLSQKISQFFEIKQNQSREVESQQQKQKNLKEQISQLINNHFSHEISSSCLMFVYTIANDLYQEAAKNESFESIIKFVNITLEKLVQQLNSFISNCQNKLKQVKQKSVSKSLTPLELFQTKKALLQFKLKYTLLSMIKRQIQSFLII